MLTCPHGHVSGHPCDAEHSAWGRFSTAIGIRGLKVDRYGLASGKYCGHTLAEVLDKDRRYCTWFVENCLSDANSATQKIFRQTWGMA